MARRGWTVVTLDIDAQFNPDILADARDWHYQGARPS